MPALRDRRCFAIALLCLAAAAMIAAMLAPRHPFDAGDWLLRWREMRVLKTGVDPFDIFARRVQALCLTVEGVTDAKFLATLRRKCVQSGDPELRAFVDASVGEVLSKGVNDPGAPDRWRDEARRLLSGKNRRNAP